MDTIANKTANQHAISLEIADLRRITGLSQAAFSKTYHIPLQTLKCWESTSPSTKRDCPIYVKELLAFKIKYDLGLLDEKA